MSAKPKIVAVVVLAGAVAALVATARRDIPADRVRELYGGPPSRFVRVDGMDVHYRDEGRGPALLLVHGTASSLHTWDGWARELASSFRVVRLDLPGFGLTGPHPARDYRIETYVATVLHFLDALGIERASVAGSSLGGRIAWQLALAHPGRVERLVLVDELAREPDPPPRVIRLARLPLAGVVFDTFTPRWLVAHNLHEVYGDPRRVTPALVDRYETLLLRQGNRQAFVDRARTIDDDSIADRLGELRVPVLVEWGEEDRWIPLALGRDLARRIPGAVLRVYPGAGHVPMEEIPEPTAADARAFLLGLEVRAGAP